MQIKGHLPASFSCCTADKCHPCRITNGWSSNYERLLITHCAIFMILNLEANATKKPEDDCSVNICQVLQMIRKAGSVEGQA